MNKIATYVKGSDAEVIFELESTLVKNKVRKKINKHE